MPYHLSDELRQSAPSIAIALPAWEQAMGASFHFEFLARLLAQKRFAAESIDLRMAELLPFLFAQWPFTEDEQRYLPICNRLRNKLIHCDPPGLLAVAQELDPEFRPRSTVQEMRIPDGATGAQLLEIITAQVGAVPVQETDARASGFVGWMMDSARNGTFAKVTELVHRGCRMVSEKRSID